MIGNKPASLLAVGHAHRHPGLDGFSLLPPPGVYQASPPPEGLEGAGGAGWEVLDPDTPPAGTGPRPRPLVGAGRPSPKRRRLSPIRRPEAPFDPFSPRVSSRSRELRFR